MTGGTETALRLTRQLHGVGRRVAYDVWEITTSQSRWLFDLARSRFQRCPLPQDHHQALAFGHWTPMTDVRIEAGRVLVVEPQHEHPVRAELSTRVHERSPGPTSSASRAARGQETD
jgi:hypothetical protein